MTAPSRTAQRGIDLESSELNEDFLQEFRLG